MEALDVIPLLVLRRKKLIFNQINLSCTELQSNLGCCKRLDKELSHGPEEGCTQVKEGKPIFIENNLYFITKLLRISYKGFNGLSSVIED